MSRGVTVDVKMLAIFAAAMSLAGQSFEVAAIKANNTGGGGHGYPFLHNGVLTTRNVSLKTILAAAYGLNSVRIFGPGWLDSEFFDLSAKAPQGVADDQIQPMLQALLKERFQAQCHMEARDVAAYDLVVNKGGAKLIPFDPAHPPVSPANTGGAAMVGVGTTAQIADMIAGAAGRPVVDRTGLVGRFSYLIRYAPMPVDAGGDSGLPDIFGAVQQQLGLRLESKKEVLDVLVVDHIDRVPSGN